ncbi:PQQ-dependent sugar dehydrogenase [Alkalimarinus sediminis]|uniref:PQQ-dependent sugar dehydrogenase n=1 Tax=Alkalimarinus sediminis TaxID=1632866 RepID=A0A9E8HJT5_9ALTE|nr:PQQ-dependent sugar dehydrogenase [Alkalimarinus sediminis]UZW75988.1 PQQ-dependent sugar dehydrogenase [Alkalimarinus sediminis]
MIKKAAIGCLLWGLVLPMLSYSKTLLTAHSDGMKYRAEQVADGLAIPWGMVFINDSQVLITERSGALKRLNLLNGKVDTISGVAAVFSEGQGGLLDIALAPDHQKTGWIYFTYSKPIQERGVTALARAKLENDRLTDWQDLLVTQSSSDTTRHFGSRIAFDNEGHLFFTVGDRGVRPNGQDLTTHAGSVLRLNLDGMVPKDNPFVKQQAVLPEIWSYGHRNPQGLSYDLKNKRLWLIEHGPRGGDELNLIDAGKNYGWPVISYGKEYWGPLSVGEATSKEGMEQPIKYYDPSIAPGSLLFYTGDAFPNWQGDLFAGALKLQHLNHIKLNSAGEAVGEERLLGDLNERIRSLTQSPEGWVYLSTDSGKIIRLMPEE